jgi:YD repeat-containing protein
VGEKHIIAVTYDAAGQLAQMHYPNGWKEFYVYDDAGQETCVLDINPAGWLTQSVAREYQYDAEGNVVKDYKRGVGGQVMEEWTNTYDDLNRLVKTEGKWCLDVIYYNYDSLGNLTFEAAPGKLTDYKYNDLNRQTKRIVNSVETTEFTYDDRGNLIKGELIIPGVWGAPDSAILKEAYTYDGTNRMTLGT